MQSVAVRLLVQREHERIAFVPATYWDLTAEMAKDGVPFKADLTHLGGIRLATGHDFDDATGMLKPNLKPGTNILLLGEGEARHLESTLATAAWRVADVKEKQKKRSPAPPFITSTLQQEASRKLRMSAKNTMRTAQDLYQKGFITYMRTDSVQLSGEAIRPAGAPWSRATEGSISALNRASIRTRFATRRRHTKPSARRAVRCVPSKNWDLSVMRHGCTI